MNKYPTFSKPTDAEQLSGKGLDATTCSVSDPLRIAWSETELIDTARRWLIATYGKPIEMKSDAEKDKFCERLGMMVDFITDQYLQNGGTQRPPTKDYEQPKTSNE